MKCAQTMTTVIKTLKLFNNIVILQDKPRDNLLQFVFGFKRAVLFPTSIYVVCKYIHRFVHLMSISPL